MIINSSTTCTHSSVKQRGVMVADLLRGEVLHASGDLVGAGHQVFEGELLVGDFTGVEGVVHAGRPTSPQVLPQVAFGGVLHQDVQRTCVQHRAQSHFQNTVNHRVVIVVSVASCGLTVLRTRSQQVDYVFVFSDHLHHLHLRHQV